MAFVEFGPLVVQQNQRRKVDQCSLYFSNVKKCPSTRGSRSRSSTDGATSLDCELSIRPIQPDKKAAAGFERKRSLLPADVL